MLMLVDVTNSNGTILEKFSYKVVPITQADALDSFLLCNEVPKPKKLTDFRLFNRQD